MTLALAMLLSSMAMVFLTFNDNSIFEGLLVAIVLSAPLIVAFLAFAALWREGVYDRHPLLAKMALGAFFFTGLLHLFWNGMMLADVDQKGGLGPAQGYSGLILWFGSIKTALFGAVVAVVVHYASRLMRR